MIEAASPGLGLRSIEILTQQIEGEARWDALGRGTRLTLKFSAAWPELTPEVERTPAA